MREQDKKLIKILNNEKKKGRKPRGFEDIVKFSYDRVGEISFLGGKRIDGKPFWQDKSFHDLFSKDSGLLDFIEFPNSYYEHKEIDKYFVRSLYRKDEIYKHASHLTWEDKITWFVDSYLNNIKVSISTPPKT